MKIVVNALRYAADAPAGGNKTYVFNLIPELVKQFSEETWILLTAGDNCGFFKREAPGADIINTSLPAKMSRRIPLEHLVIRRKLKHIEPDLYFSPATLLSIGKCRYPSVATIHDLNFAHFTQGFFKDRYKWWLYGKTCNEADGIIVNSRFTADDIYENFPISRGKVTVIYEGVDHDFFHPDYQDDVMVNLKEKHHLPDRFILSLAHFQHKNASGLLRIYAKALPDIMDDCHLIMIGVPETEKLKLRDEARSLGIETVTRFLDFISKEDYRDLLRGAEVFVFPSLFEGFGLPILEAMACGSPALSSNRASLPEVVGDAGIICDPDDTERFAGLLVGLLNDEALRGRLVVKGFERVKSFTWKKTAEKTFSVFSKIV